MRMLNTEDAKHCYYAKMIEVASLGAVASYFILVVKKYILVKAIMKLEEVAVWKKVRAVIYLQ